LSWLISVSVGRGGYPVSTGGSPVVVDNKKSSRGLHELEVVSLPGTNREYKSDGIY
jgi:hypothetical protein